MQQCDKFGRWTRQIESDAKVLGWEFTDKVTPFQADEKSSTVDETVQILKTLDAIHAAPLEDASVGGPIEPWVVEEAARRDGNWAASPWGGSSTAGWIDCRHKDISKVLRQNHMDGTRQVMHDGRLQVLKLQFGVLRLADSEERADTSQVQAATTGAL